VRGFVSAGIGVLCLSPWSAAFANTGITLVSIGIAFRAAGVARFVEKMAECSYEYYLVHGVFLVGALAALRNHPVITVACGLSLSVFASIPIAQPER
jgi:peptidoglycan/LPS O-acetylase OafA/YrhL